MAIGLIKTGQVELGLPPTEAAHSVRKQDLDGKANLVRTGDATLIAGVATIVDVDTTADTAIRLLGKTPAGAVGALFIFSKTVATGFVVHSTSSTDTSIFTYEAYE